MSDYTLRILIPVFVSFLVAVISGPWIIEMLRRLKAGQTEREEGLESHKKKTGTPVMGGIIFLIPFLLIGIFYSSSHKEIIPVLEEFDNYTNDALYELLVNFAAEHEYKNGMVLWPVRTALSGKQMTPCGATEMLELLGKEESIDRLKAAVIKLS